MDGQKTVFLKTIKLPNVIFFRTKSLLLTYSLKKKAGNAVFAA